MAETKKAAEKAAFFVYIESRLKSLMLYRKILVKRYVVKFRVHSILRKKNRQTYGYTDT